MVIYGTYTMARYVVINSAMREEGGRHAAVEAEGHSIIMVAVAGSVADLLWLGSFTSSRQRESLHFLSG